MSNSVNTNLVHESEVQRQFARVKLPATIQVKNNGNVESFALSDLSVGGCSFTVGKPFPVLKGCNAVIELDVDGFTFSVPVEFDVVESDKNGRVGCCFQNLSVNQLASLRHIITSFLNGDLVSSGDMLNILKRDNNLNARKKSVTGDLIGFNRLKAIVGSLIFFAFGVLAFAFVVFNVWQSLFVIKAQAAVVRGVGVNVNMPREGVVRLLVKQGEFVKSGQIIGAFEAPLITYLSKHINQDVEQLGALNSLAQKNYKGAIVSPCDCVVKTIYSASGQYINKGSAVAALQSVDSAPYIEAKFPLDAVDDLYLGQSVELTVLGSTIAGSVKSIYGENTAGVLVEGALVTIATNEPLDAALVGAPASVTLPVFKSALDDL